MKFKNTIARAGFIAMLLGAPLVVTACANENTYKDPELGISDPYENVNRTTLDINEAVDKAVLEPIAKGYRRATPKAVRTVTSNFLRNLNSPVEIGNQMLQGDVKGVGNATARMVINTLAGFGGILDLAEQGGIEHEPEDFGQTLATWGVGNGPYLMLPLFGPSTLRDAAGKMVDSYADPLRIYLFNIDEEHLHYTRVGVSVLSQREELIDVISDLRKNSFDYYAAVRSAYYQHRKALINDQVEGEAAEIPDYDDF
jgi:phospholipid-binding lipoprotein MlaA